MGSMGMGELFVSVADTGPGISTKDAGQLFQRYANFGTKKGSGLGLVISQLARRQPHIC